MKKILAALVIGLFTLGSVGCSGDKDKDKDKKEKKSDDKKSDDKKTDK